MREWRVLENPFQAVDYSSLTDGVDYLGLV